MFDPKFLADLTRAYEALELQRVSRRLTSLCPGGRGRMFGPLRVRRLSETAWEVCGYDRQWSLERLAELLAYGTLVNPDGSLAPLVDDVFLTKE